MSALAAWGGLALFAAGFAAAVLGDRWVRVAGMLAMLGGSAGALWSELGPTAALWALGPAVVSLGHGPGPARRRLAFDPLVRRAAVVGLLVIAAGLAAIQFPIGDLARPLAVVLWNLAAVGLAWIVTAEDDHEFVSGATLAIAGGSALLLVGSNSGPLTALLAGALAAVPSVMVSGRLPEWLAYSPPAAAGLAVLVLLFGSSSGGTLADLTLNWRPPALLTAAVVLVGIGATPSGGTVLAAIPAILMLLTTSPALRWAGLAAATTVLLQPRDRDQRLAWVGLAMLASSVVLGAALEPAPRQRLLVAALTGGWLLLVAGRRTSALQVAIATAFLLVQVPSLPADVASRFQLLAALTAVFLFAATLIEPQTGRRRLSAGLSLIGVATMTPTGTLAAILLLLDAFLMEATADVGVEGLRRSLLTLARSGWPPTIAFAGRTLAVLAAMALSTLLGVVALVLLLGLLGTPLLEQRPTAAPARPTRRAAAMAAISLAVGLVPGWVARLGHF